MIAVSLTLRDRTILDRLAQHEPLLTSELCLLYFGGIRCTRARLVAIEKRGLLTRVYPARTQRGGRSEALWFLSERGRAVLGAPSRRAPGLSIPDLEHRRAVARFFLELIGQSLGSSGEGLYSWLGESGAKDGVGGPLRPDGFGRYLMPEGEITFYLELDRGTESARRVGEKLRSYQKALGADSYRQRANVLLVCEGRRRLSHLARVTPEGPPWVWGRAADGDYELLPLRREQRRFRELPAWPREERRAAKDCLGRRFRQAPQTVAGERRPA